MATHAEPASELIVLPALRAVRGPQGGLILTRKYIDGVEQYARLWPGKVTTLVAMRDTPTSDMDHAEYMPGEVGSTRLEVRPDSALELAERLGNAAAVLAYLSPEELPTARLCHEREVPLIFVSEYTPATERQIVDAEVRNPLRRWRRKLWLAQAERKRLKALAIATGIQCSGAPAFEAYRHHARDALLFFDNRVPAAEVIDEPALESKLASLRADRPLRLAFGGRLIAMKGVLDLPLFAAELRDRGVAFTLEIHGEGQLREALHKRIHTLGLQDVVRLCGAHDFRSEWIPLLKEQVDLFICCHPQGDPSSTYPEVMSCGVPIAGYANEAFAGIVRHSGSGWLVPLHSPADLAQVVAELDAHRARIAEAARAAREFALRCAFEATFEARTRHLIKLSRLG